MAKNNAIKILRGSRSAINSSSEKLEYGQLLYNKDDNFLYCGNAVGGQIISEVEPIYSYQLRRGGSNTTNDDDGISFTADEGLKISTHDNKITLSENGTNEINLTYNNNGHVLTSDTAIALKQKNSSSPTGITTIGWTNNTADLIIDVNTTFGSNSNEKVVVTASDSNGTKTPSIKVQSSDSVYTETTPTYIRAYSTSYLTNITPGSINLNGTLNSGTLTSGTGVTLGTNSNKDVLICSTGATFKGSVQVGYINDTYSGVILSSDNTSSSLSANKPFKVTDSSTTTTITSTNITLNDNIILTAAKGTGTDNDTLTIGTSTTSKSCDAIVSGDVVIKDATLSYNATNTILSIDKPTAVIGNIFATNGDISATKQNGSGTGGNISADGTLTIGGSGGAIFSYSSSVLSIDKSTSVSGNVSTSGTLTIGSSGATLEWDGTNSKLQTNSKMKTADTMEAATFIATSDKRLKTNIVPFTNLNKNRKSILDLPIYEFDYIKTPNIHTIGCMAQDLQKICPELVSEDANGYLSIAESKLIYLLLEEVKILKEQINSLK